MATPLPLRTAGRTRSRYSPGMAIRAIVSDQGDLFDAQIIGTGPEFTVTAFLELPRGSWVAFATATFGNSDFAPGTSVVQAAFLLDGDLYSTIVNSNFTVPDNGEGFLVVPLTTGLTLETTQTLQVGCLAARPNTIESQQTTITAIQVDSMTRIRNQAPGITEVPETANHSTAAPPVT
jgi:hypothetical protein